MQKFQKGVDLDTVLAGDMDGTCAAIELLQCDVIHGIVIRTSDFIHGSFVPLVNTFFIADLIHELTAIYVVLQQCCDAAVHCICYSVHYI